MIDESNRKAVLWGVAAVAAGGVLYCGYKIAGTMRPKSLPPPRTLGSLSELSDLDEFLRYNPEIARDVQRAKRRTAYKAHMRQLLR